MHGPRSFARVPYTCALALALALLGSACGGDEERSPASLDPRCAPLIEECRSNQMTCSVLGGAPRCTPCDAGEYAASDGLCQALTGETLSHDFPEITTEPGGEILNRCRSWTLNNPTELWVNAVELEQDEASHHSNWTFAPQDKFPGPDGLWPCAERKYDQLTAALAGGVLYAQSTQARREVQKFPDGVAIRIPPFSTVISAVHTLNTTSAPVTGNIRLKIYTTPATEVSVPLAPFHLTYDELDIPPRSTARFSGRCDLDAAFRAARQADGFQTKIYWILPHTHALGSRFFVELFGDSGSQTLLDIAGFNGEARGRTYDTPIDTTGFKGIGFGCEFENPRAENVVWGFGDQEMCELLGFAESPLGFESRIQTINPDGSEGDVQRFTGPCTTIAFPWAQDRPGGEQ